MQDTLEPYLIAGRGDRQTLSMYGPVDRLASADPSRVTRRYTMPTWFLSVVVHGSILAALLITIPRISRGLQPPDEDAREVGILLKSEVDSHVVFESPDQKFVEMPTEADQTLPELAELDHEPVDDVGPELLPQVESSLLRATSPNTNAASGLPFPSDTVGQSRSRTTFWNVESIGNSFVFVIDRSASMTHRNALELAKKELFAALDQLSPDSRFQVIFYNTEAGMLPMGNGELIEANPANLLRARKEIERVTPEGGTNHLKSLQLAFKLEPEVMYFLTDADMLSDDDVLDLTHRNRKASIPATIYAIEFGTGPNLSSSKPLRKLAAENDGIYTYFNVQDIAPSLGRP